MMKPSKLKINNDLSDGKFEKLSEYSDNYEENQTSLLNRKSVSKGLMLSKSISKMSNSQPPKEKYTETSNEVTNSPKANEEFQDILGEYERTPRGRCHQYPEEEDHDSTLLVNSNFTPISQPQAWVALKETSQQMRNIIQQTTDDMDDSAVSNIRILNDDASGARKSSISSIKDNKRMNSKQYSTHERNQFAKQAAMDANDPAAPKVTTLTTLPAERVTINTGENSKKTTYSKVISSFGNGILILNEANGGTNKSTQNDQIQPDDEYEAMKNIFDQNMSFEIKGPPIKPPVPEMMRTQQHQSPSQYTNEQLREYEFRMMQQTQSSFLDQLERGTQNYHPNDHIKEING